MKKKKLLITILIVLIVPVLVLTALYFTVAPFRDIANDVFSGIPGPVGETFRNQPNEEEIKEQLSVVSDYLLKADTEKAVDKLVITESSDKRTFDLLIADMNRLDPNRTSMLLNEIRKRKLSVSPIASTIEKIQEEEDENNKMDADLISGLNIYSQVEAIKKILDEEQNSHRRVAKILEKLEEKTATDILYNLKETDRDLIIKELDSKKALDYKKKIYETKEKTNDMTNTARLLKDKNVAELAPIIGQSSAYTTDELIAIYREFGPKKAGEVLAKINDDNFTNTILEGIRDAEILEHKTDIFTENLITSLNIYREYDDKMDRLVSTYKEMEEKRVAETVKTLYWSTGISKTYYLKNGEEITISDEDLALDLLRSFPPKKIAAILSHLDNRIASDIFTKLALPKSR